MAFLKVTMLKLLYKNDISNLFIFFYTRLVTNYDLDRITITHNAPDWNYPKECRDPPNPQPKIPFHKPKTYIWYSSFIKLLW